ncbi:MAG: hypothetical protein GY708_12540 [Actinomycetia bacterium]|nr:hypothetical protein [Actinomycetes bacterium]
MVEGVVTSVFAPDWFYVMEEDFEVDADPSTPENTLVSCGAACPLAAGDLAR